MRREMFVLLRLRAEVRAAREELAHEPDAGELVGDLVKLEATIAVVIQRIGVVQRQGR